MATIDIQDGQSVDVSIGNDYRLPIKPFGQGATTQILATTGLKFTQHFSNNGSDISNQVPGGLNQVGYPAGTIYGETGAGGSGAILAVGDAVEAVIGSVVYLIFRITAGSGRICPSVGPAFKVLA